jgi:hypothetical protein
MLYNIFQITEVQNELHPQALEPSTDDDANFRHKFTATTLIKIIRL